MSFLECLDLVRWVIRIKMECQADPEAQLAGGKEGTIRVIPTNQTLREAISSLN
jgi:hypothetical protein